MIDAEAQVMSEDTETGDETLIDNAKLVPVAESIRYRRRAQSAERKVEELTEQLNQAKSETTNLSDKLNQAATEKKLVGKLASSGAVDIETALLLAKTKLNGDADVDDVVEQLKKEKAYLFAEQKSSDTATAKRTASAKDRLASSNSALERAAKRAAASGSATDLQQYLKLRRNYV